MHYIRRFNQFSLYVGRKQQKRAKVEVLEQLAEETAEFTRDSSREFQSKTRSECLRDGLDLWTKISGCHREINKTKLTRSGMQAHT